jgi:hypothetical protein
MGRAPLIVIVQVLVAVMANMLPSILPNNHSDAGVLFSRGYNEEYLDNMIKKIGFVAACIDLHGWRSIIDEVLSEVEAANEKASLLETALQDHPTQTPKHAAPS